MHSQTGHALTIPHKLILVWRYKSLGHLMYHMCLESGTHIQSTSSMASFIAIHDFSMRLSQVMTPLIKRHDKIHIRSQLTEPQTTTDLLQIPFQGRLSLINIE